MDLRDCLRRCSEKIKSLPKTSRIRIISHYDTDGICSAYILAKAIEREGFDFHITLLEHPVKEEIERLGDEDSDAMILSDLGSSFIDTISKMGMDSIILDHHQPEDRDVIKGSVIQVNSNLFGIDGDTDASGSSLCYLLAKEINKGNIDLSPFALMGTIGDKQSLGGFSGVNREIFDEARREGFIKISRPSLKLGDGPIIQEINLSVDPFYPGLSGREEEIGKLLDRLSIREDARYSEIGGEEKKRLHSFLMLTLLRNNIDPLVANNIIKERILTEKLPLNLDVISEMIDACSKSNDHGLALSFLFNPEDLYERIKRRSEAYKIRIIEKLREIEDRGLKETRNIVYFTCDKASDGSYMSGIVSSYFDCKNKPVFSFSKDRNKIHVSCRARRRMVERGLDLGGLMRSIAQRFGGSGGGHKIAAGATLEETDLDEIVRYIDDIIGKEYEGKV